MSRRPLFAPIALLSTAVLVVAACIGGGPTPPPGTTPGPSPSDASTDPPPGPIAHPTGPTDVILRFEEGGGFVPFGFLLTQAPEFTLYGDGTIVLRNVRLDPLPDVGGVSRMHPFRTTRISENDIQALLAFALVDGGLGRARPHYEHHQIADGPSAVFTIDADGTRREVSVYALGFEGAPPTDIDARRGFLALADRLRALAADPAFAPDPYEPHGYRGVLSEGFPGNPERAWPWPDIAPETFGPPDPNGSTLRQRVLTPDEMAAIGVPGFEGGILNVMLRGPDGALYGLSAKPLLRDEAE